MIYIYIYNTKIQVTQQHNISKLRSTCKIKEIIIKDKIQ